jgi:hypothetical protein
MENVIQTITVYAIPGLFAITLHEAAHGYVARMFGDNTAYVAGRDHAESAAHIDPIGTIVGAAGMVLLSGLHVRLGQAGAGRLRQPAQAEARHDLGRRRRPRRQPAMAVGWALLCQALLLPACRSSSSWSPTPASGEPRASWRSTCCRSRRSTAAASVGLLPTRPLAYQFARIEPYGLFIMHRAAVHRRAVALPVAPFLQLGAADRPFGVVHLTMYPTAFFPACAPPARCTSATSTAR